MTPPELKIDVPVSFRTGGRGRKRRAGPRPAKAGPAAEGRLPRVTRLMALALRIERLVQDGQVASYAEVARLGHVTRARMSQIMGLVNLAPDIIEQILNMPPVTGGRDPVSERQLRPIAAESKWAKQRQLMRAVWRG